LRPRVQASASLLPLLPAQVCAQEATGESELEQSEESAEGRIAAYKPAGAAAAAGSPGVPCSGTICAAIVAAVLALLLVS